MKRMILCPRCSERFRDDFPNDEPYPGEHVRVVPGINREDCVCDTCNAVIRQNEKCYAVSIWVDGRGIKYYEWEHVFLNVN